MRSGYGLLTALLLTGAPSVAFAQSEAKTAYPLSPQAGAWLICVKSYMTPDDPNYTGPKAFDLAEELATEIRQKYKMNSFVFNRGTEEREKERQRVEQVRRQQEEFAKQFGQPIQGRPRIRTIRIPDQYAVLVGGWQDMDAARKALDGIRKLPPPSTKLMDAALASNPVPGQKGQSKVEIAYVNPFAAGFVVPNPLVPRPKDENNGQPDPIIFELNEGEEYSVLRCRKPWTLVVRVYQGGVVMQAQHTSTSNDTFLQKLGLSRGKNENLLTASALQANQMAKTLRELKEFRVNAYVMHTRYSSIVCVGEYDRPDDPQLLHMQKALANLKVGTADQLMSLPLPMEIPRKK